MNNKGREGAIIDFSLMAYEGTLSAKSFAGYYKMNQDSLIIFRIMTHTIKTLSSFLEEDFSISLSLEEMIELEGNFPATSLFIDLFRAYCFLLSGDDRHACYRVC